MKFVNGVICRHNTFNPNNTLGSCEVALNPGSRFLSDNRHIEEEE